MSEINKLNKRIIELENSILKLDKRNKKVESEKSWETSTFRKISIAIVTYIIILLIMFLLGFKNIFINALIPTLGFLLSTLSMNILKNIYFNKK